MKKICLLIMVALLSLEAYAQLAPAPQPLEDFETIGISKYEVCYSFKFKKHHTDKGYIEDTRIVQIGDGLVKDYSDIVYHFDSLATENFRKGLPTSSNTNETYPCEIFNYHKKKEIKVKYRLLLNGGVLCYDDTYPTFDWNFSSETPVEVRDTYAAKQLQTLQEESIPYGTQWIFRFLMVHISSMVCLVSF